MITIYKDKKPNNL